MNKWWIIGIIAIVVIAIIVIAVKYGKKSGELSAVKNQPGVYNPYQLTQLSKKTLTDSNGKELTMGAVKL